MAKVTTKYQVTVPRKIADEFDIHPGDEIDWVPAGDVIRVIPSRKPAAREHPESQLRLFDQATARHHPRKSPAAGKRLRNRGWKREDLYVRGRSR